MNPAMRFDTDPDVTTGRLPSDPVDTVSMDGGATSPIDCHADPVGAARHLAAAFKAGRRLVVVAPDHPDHAHHVAVEFLHPAVTGSVALPAVVAPSALATRAADRRTDDVVLAIGIGADWTDGPSTVELIISPLADAEIMVCYHLLWELVQLELDTVHPADHGHPDDAAQTDGDATEFLYPFLDGAVSEATTEMVFSARVKAAESAEVARTALAVNGELVEMVADLLADSTAAGGRVLTMGNGGSACDAARAVRLLTARGLPAQSLAADYAVVTALGNDLGSERIFTRQLEALGRRGDLLIGFSTSGTSTNLLAAFDQAKRDGLSTVGFAGYDGVGFVSHPSVDQTLAVDSQSVHRIQEAQAVLLDAIITRLDQTRAAEEQR